MKKLSSKLRFPSTQPTRINRLQYNIIVIVKKNHVDTSIFKHKLGLIHQIRQKKEFGQAYFKTESLSDNQYEKRCKKFLIGYKLSLNEAHIIQNINST